MNTRRSFLASVLAACTAAVAAPAARAARVRREYRRRFATTSLAVSPTDPRFLCITHVDGRGRTWVLAKDAAEAWARAPKQIYVDTGGDPWRFWTLA